MRNRLLVALLLTAPGVPCLAQGAGRRAAAPSVDAQGLPRPGDITGSLVDAVNSIDEPNLVAVFAYVPLNSQPSAFAELMTRDHKGLKRYAAKLTKDTKVAGGLTAWDHEVCAVLINRFQVAVDKSGLPDKRRMAAINKCMLTPVVSLEQILLRRKS